MGLDMLNEEMATDILNPRRGQSPIVGRAGVMAGLSDQKLTPAFLKQLEYYYIRSGTADKSNCLDLIASIKLKHQIEPTLRKYRPKTAMPSLGGHPSSDIRNPYVTKYNSEYYPKKESQTRAIRPMTSYGFTNEQTRPLDQTTYKEEYSGSCHSKTIPIRSGTSSGSRNNKPHPQESFMVWRFPSKTKQEEFDTPKITEQQVNEKLSELHKRFCSSTYSNDYLGIPQGFQVHSAFAFPPEDEEKVPYRLSTNSRFSYQGARQNPNLQGPVTRYACNTKKHIPAIGTVPTASSHFNRVKNNTWYDYDYNEGSGEVTRQIQEEAKRREEEAVNNYQKAEDTARVGQCSDPIYPACLTPRPPSHSRHQKVPQSTYYTDYKAPQLTTSPQFSEPRVPMNSPTY